MDRETSTKLIAKLIAATQSGKVSWQKQSSRRIVAADHATSAVYFCEFGDLGFRLYHYRWERADYYSWHDNVPVEIEPPRSRGVMLELLDSDGDLIEKIQNAYVLRDLFDVANQNVTNIEDKIRRVLNSNLPE